MAAYWDHENTSPIRSTHNSCHEPTTTFQPPLPERLDHMRPPSASGSEHHGLATPFGPLIQENNILPISYYEGYTIRPDDSASGEDRWELPPKKSIPATQEDLHTEVIRQRQTGRTACRELEDCHGPKRQYIDKLIRERNASTSLGYFEVALLRLERIPSDSEKASNRNSGRTHQARDYKLKDSTKPRQKTVYMHIILRFMRDPNKSHDERLPDESALRNQNVHRRHGSRRRHTSDGYVFVPPTFSDEFPMLPVTSQRPIPAREYPYPTGIERVVSPLSSRYFSRGTQTTFPAHTRPYSDGCCCENTDDATLRADTVEDTWSTTTKTEDRIRRNSTSDDDGLASKRDSAVVYNLVDGSIEKESKGIDEYEKPPWFQNLQPVKSPGVRNDQRDVCYQQDDEEISTTHEEEDTDDACEQDDDEVVKAYGKGDTGYARPSISSWLGKEIGQRSPDSTENHMPRDGDNDQSPDHRETHGAPMATEVRRLTSVDKHGGTGPANIPMSEYLRNLAGPPPQENVPPSEKYKPRPAITPLPARPSLTRASGTYDGRPTDDSERKSSKRVSFQQEQAPTLPHTPPSTSTSSPVSPSASPQLPFRFIPAKPPPVSIPPGQYTPPASSSSSSGRSTSPSSPHAPRKPYICLEPTCGSSFDHPSDRDRHELRQHEIGDPPYSCCPVCHFSRSGGAAVDEGVRELLVGHINRRH